MALLDGINDVNFGGSSLEELFWSEGIPEIVSSDDMIDINEDDNTEGS